MGLFIGASILTILELFDYLYEVHQYFPSSSGASHLDNTSSAMHCLCKFVPLQYYGIICSQNQVFHTLASAQGHVLASVKNALSLTILQPISV